MTPDASHLLDQVSYTSGEQVFVGNGKGLQIHHVGTFVFKPFSSYSFKLKNLLHVPHIKKNLLSVSQFARDNNIYFEFYPNSCYANHRIPRRHFSKEPLRVACIPLVLFDL